MADEEGVVFSFLVENGGIVIFYFVLLVCSLSSSSSSSSSSSVCGDDDDEKRSGVNEVPPSNLFFLFSLPLFVLNQNVFTTKVVDPVVLHALDKWEGRKRPTTTTTAWYSLN